LRTYAPVLSNAANELGDPQVRNRGTIGGACAHGDPSADYPAVMLSLGATFTLTGEGGTREIGADEFFIGMFETALDPLEMLTGITFPVAPNSAYEKFHHPASGYAVVGAAVNLTLEKGTIAQARVAFTGVGDAAFRAPNVEAALAGVSATDNAKLDAACRDAAAGIDARSDTFASAEYRVAMADVFLRRAVARALQPG
jgi:carbon-monoxide dehydrogenase medium subunit